MAQKAIEIMGGKGTLQKEITGAERLLEGLEQRVNSITSGISEMFSSMTFSHALEETQKTVKRTTTTVRKEAKKAVAAFDEIQKLSGGSTSTTVTTSTTTTETEHPEFYDTSVEAKKAATAIAAEAIAVENLTNMFAVLKEAMASAEAVFQNNGIIRGLMEIRVQAMQLQAFFSNRTITPVWLGSTAQAIWSILNVLEILGVDCSKLGGVIGGFASQAARWFLNMLTPAVDASANSFGLLTTQLVSGVARWTEATGVTAGFGNTVGFLTNPIGSAVLAITSLVTVAVTLVRSWDTVSTAISTAADSLFGKLRAGFAEVKAVMEFFGGFLQDIFAEDWTNSFGAYGNVLNAFLANSQNVFNAVRGMFSGVITFVKSVFTGEWGAAWKGIVEIFRNVWNYLLSGVKAPINGIIGIVNGLVQGVTEGINLVIKALNGISFEIPQWVPVVGGNKIGFQMKTLKVPRIPYLAQGAVIPANKPFMAVLGDQRHGTNVEAPLETIKQALAEVLALQSGQSSGDVVIRFEGDLAHLGRVLKPVIDRENHRVGGSLLKGVY